MAEFAGTRTSSTCEADINDTNSLKASETDTSTSSVRSYAGHLKKSSSIWKKECFQKSRAPPSGMKRTTGKVNLCLFEENNGKRVNYN